MDTPPGEVVCVGEACWESYRCSDSDDINDIILITRRAEVRMANLIVRNVEDEVVRALKARSGEHGVSAEEEHRRILRQALLQPRRRSFAEVLAEIPNVGIDEDFTRSQDDGRADVFD